MTSAKSPEKRSTSEWIDDIEAQYIKKSSWKSPKTGATIKQTKRLIARVKRLEAALIRSLELDLCHETSCPYPCRAMCNNESHKVRREALSEDIESQRLAGFTGNGGTK